jgi:catalase
MRTDGNLGGTPTYFPNSLGEWIDQPLLNEPPLEITGAAAHWDHRVDDDHWQQPGDLFRKMNQQQNRCCSTTQPVRWAKPPSTSRTGT